MAIVLPDPRLEHPGLLIPGRKPTCPVVIDWSHRLSEGLSHYILFHPGRAYDLVTGRSLSIGGGPRWTPDGVYFDETDDYYILNDVTLNSQCSILTQAKFTDNTGSLYQYFISFKGFTQTNSLNWYLHEDSVASPNRLRLINTSDPNAADYENYYPSDNGKPIAAVLDGSTLRQFVGGSLAVESSGSGGITDGTTDDLHVGQRSDSNSSRRFGGKLPYVMVYGNRAICAAEAFSLNANPYQFLIPE